MKESKPGFALAWMSGTLLSFSLMAIAARELSDTLATPQILFVRSVIGLVCIAAILAFSKRPMQLRTQVPGLHTLRNIFHFGGQYGWFLGISLLPLAEVFALEFTVPIWTLIIAALFLGERITRQKSTAILLGTIGVCVILQPGVAIIDAASLIVLASAICYAVAHSCTKSLSATEPALSILFYMCLIQLPIGLLLSITDWVWPSGINWMWLLIVGMTALSAHFCMAKAMAHAEVTTIVTLDFLRLPLIALIGVLFYNEELELALLLGALLMLGGNLISLKQRPPGSPKESTDS